MVRPGREWKRSDLLLGALLADLRDGDVVDEFPSVPEISDRYDVVPATIAGAVADLVGLGVLKRRRGFRNEVVPQVVLRRGDRHAAERRPLNMSGFFADAEEAGAKPTIDVLSIDEVPCPAAAAWRLGVDRHEPVLCRKRRYGLNGTPIQVAWSYVPLWVVERLPVLRKPDTGVGGYYARLGEVGLAPTDAQEEVWARLPSVEEAELLRPPGLEPVLSVWRTVWTGDQAVEAVRIALRGHAVRLVYDVGVD